MKDFLYKLFLGSPTYNKPLKNTPYQTYVRDLKNTWDNKRHHDTGLEKVLRLFLVSIQIIFPAMHIMQAVGKVGVITRNLVKEFYVVFKTLLPLVILMNDWYANTWAITVSIYFMTETFLYVISIIFVSDIFIEPRSYRRNLLMLFLNYLEICFNYAVIYAGLDLLTGKVTGYVDYIYFSIVTSTTIGYGDISPATDLGKVIVSTEAILSLAFIGLFLNFFGSKMEHMYRDEEL
jgi:hypothetical protein